MGKSTTGWWFQTWLDYFPFQKKVKTTKNHQLVWVSFNVSITYIYMYEELGCSTIINVIIGWVGA